MRRDGCFILRNIAANNPGAGAEPGNAYYELRLPSSAANPYLVLAGVVAAGHDFIDMYDALGDDAPPDPFALVETKRLPTNLSSALDELNSDEVLIAALGKPFIDTFTRVKRAEVEEVSERLGVVTGPQILTAESVGRRIRVFWDSNESFDGVVDKFNDKSNYAQIKYDDGGEEWIGPEFTDWTFLERDLEEVYREMYVGYV